MIPKEHYIGTIFNNYRIVGIERENDRNIEFAVINLSQPDGDKLVLKFQKHGNAMFELNVLPDGFEIDIKNYPNHPQRISKEERFKILSHQILNKLKSNNLLLESDVFRGLYVQNIEIFAHVFIDDYEKGTLSKTFLEDHPGIKVFCDDNFSAIIKELLNKGLIAERARNFYVFLLEEFKRFKQKWVNSGNYYPLNNNPLVKALALSIVNYMNDEELIKITMLSSYSSSIKENHIEDLYIVIQYIHTYASKEAQKIKIGDKNDPLNLATLKLDNILSALRIGCDYLSNISASDKYKNSHRLALSEFWKLKSFFLKNDQALNIENSFNELIAKHDNFISKPTKHNLYLELANYLLKSSQKEKASKYFYFAQQIRKDLEQHKTQ